MPGVNPYAGSIGIGFPLPPIMGTTISSIPLSPDFDSKYYVEGTIEGSIYVLIHDDEETPLIQDALTEGIHCLKVQNVAGVQTSYSVKMSGNNYTLSLYQDIRSLRYIWAWDKN